MVLNLFAELPEAVVTLIVSTWLGNRELGNLDSACCSTETRPTFLAAVRFARCSFGPKYDRGLAIKLYFDWLVDRKAKLSSLSLNTEIVVALSNPKEFLEFIECNCGKDLRRLRLFNIYIHHDFVLEAIAEHCDGLEFIEFCGCDDVGELEDILFSSQMTLHTLNMCFDDGFALKRDGMTFPFLRSLSMEGEFNGACYAKMFSACPYLFEVELRLNQHTLPSTALEALGNAAEHLHRLRLDLCGFEQHQTFDTLAQQCSHLVRLELTGIARTTTPTLLALFTQHCRSLAAVLVSCAFPEDERPTLEALAKQPKLRHLSLLGFGTCELKDWAALAAKVKSLHSLSIQLNDFHNPPKDYIPLVQAQRHLRHLHLCTAPAEVFPVLAQRCPLLELLVVQHREDCTYEGLQQVVEGCPRLKRVRLFGLGTAQLIDLWQKVGALGKQPWVSKIKVVNRVVGLPFWK